MYFYRQKLQESNQKLQENIQTLEKLKEQLRNINLDKGNKWYSLLQEIYIKNVI
jgi:hypothetical protein